MNIDSLNAIDNNKIWTDKLSAASSVDESSSQQSFPTQDTYIKDTTETQQAKESSNLSVKKDNEKKNDEDKNAKDIDQKGMKHLDIDNTVLSFQKHKETGEIMVKIIDKQTGEVIREIPPEKILDSIAELWKCSGINVDKKI